MRLGAYQFKVTSDIGENLATMLTAIRTAAQRGVELLAFPECALTGYPPHDLPTASAINEELAESAIRQLIVEVDRTGVAIIFGTITKEDKLYFNTAVFCAPKQQPFFYHKRALWGWDAENFSETDGNGVVEFGGFKIGLRICFEVRFPEYFRELYRIGTDLNVILFYEISPHPNSDRYNLISSHIRTRAVENVCPVLTVNTTAPFQTAPTCLIDASGHILAEHPIGVEGMLFFEYNKTKLDFGEIGRKTISDKLCLQKQPNC